MSLVRLLGYGAIAVITAHSVEKGWRKGTKNGQDNLAEFDANVLMRSGMTSTDSVIGDKAASTLRKQFLMNDGVMSDVYRSWHGVKKICKELFVENFVPLAIAGVSAWAKGPVGAIGLGLLALWGGAKVVKSSGLVKTNPSNVLDINI